MTDALSNARAGFLPRAAWVAVPAVFSMFLLGGVTTGPALDLAAAREAKQHATERQAHFAEVTAERDRLAAARVAARLDGALAEVRAFVPSDLDPVDAHSLLRLVAKDVGVELSLLDVGQCIDLGLPGGVDRIEGRSVCVAGRASPAALVRLVDRLRELGQPCSVGEFALQRDGSKARNFDFRLCLLLHVAKPVRQPGNVAGADGVR